MRRLSCRAQLCSGGVDNIAHCRLAASSTSVLDESPDALRGFHIVLRMAPINLQRLRQQDFGAHEHAYDERDLALYALGVGELRRPEMTQLSTLCHVVSTFSKASGQATEA